MSPVVRAANAAEFLSVVPVMLGFQPRRSLVMIPFAGSRSLGAMRFDLPDTDVDAVAATVLGLVCRVQEADAVAIVVYADDAICDGLPHAELVGELIRRADACGLSVTDALCVGRDAWATYLDADGPTETRPLEEIPRPPDEFGALDVACDQASGAELPDVDADEREDLARAVAALDDAVRVLCGPDSVGDDPEPDSGRRIDPQALAAACALDDLPTLFEDSLDWDPAGLSPFDAATLLWCLGRPSLRDIALAQWCRGFSAGDEALDAQLRWESGEEYPAHLAMQMWGEGERPDAVRLATALALVRRLAAAAPHGSQTGPLAVAAWISWALGRSTHAESYAAAARVIDPDHGLSEIVLSFVAAGHLPDWAFARPSRAPLT
jgi:hypothetical protein